MMSSRKYSLNVGFLLLISINVWAQNGVKNDAKYGHGQDSINCLMNMSLFYEEAKQQNFKDAVEPWKYCFEHCPAASRNIYKYGVQIVLWQYNTAQTSIEKDEKIALLMQVYDQRIQYFGNHPKFGEAWILGEKASALLKLKDDVASEKEVYKWFLESINALGPEAKTSNLQEFMQVNFSLFQMSEINAEELLNNYELVQLILDDQIANETNPTTKKGMEKLREANANNIANTGILDCNMMEELFAAKIKGHKEDADYLTKSMSFFEKTGCIDNASYQNASEYLFALQPDAHAAKAIAESYLKRDEIDEALKYYNKAIALEESADKRAELYYTIAKVYFNKKNDFSMARKFTNQAIQDNNTWGEPYMFIGFLYAQSAQKQILGSKDIENMAGYWAAVDKYKQAIKVDPSIKESATIMIQQYSNFFPDNELIFFENDYEEGKMVSVGGWINERTIVRAKGE